MSIFDRIRRIVKANMNLLLDKVEVAEQELDSKIKELEEIIHEGMRKIGIELILFEDHIAFG